MKSSLDFLEKRGFFREGAEIEFENLTIADKLRLLESKVPKERTLGARLLSQEKSFVTNRLIEKRMNTINEAVQKVNITITFLCETLWVTLKNSVVQLFIFYHRVTRSENTENHRVFGQPHKSSWL